MRKLILGLAILFFLLSGFILYRAFEIPVYSYYQEKPKEPETKSVQPQVNEAEEQLAKEKEASQEMINQLQSTIANLEDKLSSMKEQIKEEVKAEKPVKKPEVLAILGGGTFSSGQTVINESMMGNVLELVPKIMDAPDYRVIIEGHTDNMPVGLSVESRYSDNMELSFLRAKAVANVFIEKGVPSGRISVVGYGDSRPVTSNETREGRAKNRRVVVKLVPEESGI